MEDSSFKVNNAKCLHPNGFRDYEKQKLQDEFKKIFGVNFQHFYDPNGLTIDDKIWIDIIKFDDFLDDHHSDLRNGRPMFDLILDEYGADAVKLIEKLMPDKIDFDFIYTW